MDDPLCDYCHRPEPPNHLTGRPTRHPKDVKSITCSTCVMALTGGGLKVKAGVKKVKRVRGGRPKRRRRG